MGNNKRIVSTVLISLLVLINLYIVFFFFCRNTLSDFFEGKINTSENGAIVAFVVIALGVVFVIIFLWHILIIIVHSICLIFSIKNRKSSLKSIRIINYVLDVLNVVLIITPLILIIMCYL